MNKFDLLRKIKSSFEAMLKTQVALKEETEELPKEDQAWIKENMSLWFDENKERFKAASQ